MMTGQTECVVHAVASDSEGSIDGAATSSPSIRVDRLECNLERQYLLRHHSAIHVDEQLMMEQDEPWADPNPT